MSFAFAFEAVVFVSVVYPVAVAGVSVVSSIFLLEKSCLHTIQYSPDRHVDTTGREG